jgi:hypothetical protein
MCDRCVLKLYSAASETSCPECSTPLGNAERLIEFSPLPRPLRGRQPGAMKQLAVDGRRPE